MYTLVQGARLRGSAGEPIPSVYPTLKERGLRFVRGQFCLFSAPPGAGKSPFALNLCLRSGEPSYYFSADSDPFTTRTRAIAMLSGDTMADVEAAEIRGDDRLDRVVAGLPVRLNFDSALTFDSVERSIMAYDEVYGEYPGIIVVDNVTNIVADDDGYEKVMDFLHSLARTTRAFVLGLHHVTGSYNNSDQPIPLNGVRGQLTAKPEVVLTGYSYSDGLTTFLRVSIVKNRGGPSDPSGQLNVDIPFDGATMHFGGQR